MSPRRVAAVIGALPLIAVPSIAIASTAHAAGLEGSGGSSSTSPAAGASAGQVTVVQAVPGSLVGVKMDGRTVQEGASAGSVLGPFTMPPGEHSVLFTNVQGTSISQQITVKAGVNRDVVLHLPQSAEGKPEVNTYRTPGRSIGPEKGRVLVAHTANVGAADVAFDGTVIFNGVTNGQYAEADVPSGSHEVQLFPAGEDTKPVLGPVAMNVPASTVTMSYVYGSPSDDSMKVVSHTSRISSAGTAAPKRIHTGSAGLAGDLPSAFGVPGAQDGAAAWSVWLSWALALPTLGLLGLSALRRTRRSGPSGVISSFEGSVRSVF